MRPLISVIVPVYNVEQYLRQCIESILKQSYREIEVLLINDGSTDSSGIICQEFVGYDNRCRYFEKENGGLSDARNYGLDRSEGEYITFVDSDDFLMDNAIEKLYATALLGDSDLVVGAYCRFDEPTFLLYSKEDLPSLPVTFVDKSFAMNQMDELTDFQFIMYSTAWGKLYKRSLFEEIRFPFGKYAEDQFTTLKLYMKASTISICNHVIYSYRINYSGLSSSFNLSHLDYIEALEERIEKTRHLDGIDMGKTYKMYDYVLRRMLTELSNHGYLEERQKLEHKIESLKLDHIIN